MFVNNKQRGYAQPMAGASYVLGVDLGGTKILAAVVSQSGEILGRAKKKTKPERPAEEILGRIAACCREAVEAAQVPLADITAVGIGSPGPLDPIKGTVIETPNINLVNAPITGFLSQDLGVPAYIDNDVNVGTFGEYVYGAGQGRKHVIGIFMGTGIGGGLIVDGKLLHGFSYNAGELGHIKLVVNGRKCGCGQRGCLEAYASKTAMIRSLQRSIKKGKSTILTKLIGEDWSKLTSSVFSQAVEAKDKLVLREIKTAARFTGIGVGSLINVLSPEMVIIGGGLMGTLSDLILPIIQDYAKKNCFPIMYEGVEIVPARLGDDAGILGAAAIAWEKVNLAKTGA